MNYQKSEQFTSDKKVSKWEIFRISYDIEYQNKHKFISKILPIWSQSDDWCFSASIVSYVVRLKANIIQEGI